VGQRIYSGLCGEDEKSNFPEVAWGEGENGGYKGERTGEGKPLKNASCQTKRKRKN